MNHFLEVKDFSYTIGEKTILKNISFGINKGDFISIIGPNGAGKTTLLKCLDGILPLEKNVSIYLDGKQLTKYSRRDLSKKISYVPQAERQTFPFTVTEFIFMGRYPYISPFSQFGLKDNEVVRWAISCTGLESLANRRINSLSGGERQKVFIAAALAQETEIILLDEPTAFLDYKHQIEIKSILENLNKKSGVTMIAVTHDVNSAVANSDSVIAVKEGCIKFQGCIRDLMNVDLLREIYDTSFNLLKNPTNGGFLIVPGKEE